MCVLSMGQAQRGGEDANNEDDEEEECGLENKQCSAGSCNWTKLWHFVNYYYFFFFT